MLTTLIAPSPVTLDTNARDAVAAAMERLARRLADGGGAVQLETLARHVAAGLPAARGRTRLNFVWGRSAERRPERDGLAHLDEALRLLEGARYVDVVACAARV